MIPTNESGDHDTTIQASTRFKRKANVARIFILSRRGVQNRKGVTSPLCNDHHTVWVIFHSDGVPRVSFFIRAAHSSCG